MIRTKHLIASLENSSPDGSSVMFNEYMEEIIKRLREYDKLIEGIENLLATMSNEVDT